MWDIACEVEFWFYVIAKGRKGFNYPLGKYFFV